MPIAAATPIAGAPRITIVLMARATSGCGLAADVDFLDGQLALVDHHDGVGFAGDRRKHRDLHLKIGNQGFV